MNFNQSIKQELTETRKRYLASLKKQLKNIELLGKKGNAEWWEIAESIDEIENNM